MPRSERAPEMRRKERRWLPVLAPRQPTPVPNPVRVGEPSVGFPQPWAIMTWVPGEPQDRTPISRGGHPGAHTEGFDYLFHDLVPDDIADGWSSCSSAGTGTGASRCQADLGTCGPTALDRVLRADVA